MYLSSLRTYNKIQGSFSALRMTDVKPLTSKGSDEGEVDLDFFVDLDHESAGIFEAPLDVGDGEGSDAVELVALNLDLHGQVDLMRRTDEGEDAVDPKGGVAGWVEGSGDAGGREGDGFEVRRFEFVFQHAVIAHGVAALTAEGIDDYGAGGFAGGEIEGDLSLLDVKGALDDVEAVGEGEVDFAAGGIEGEFLLGLESGGGGGDEKEHDAEKVARSNETGRGAGRTNRAKGHSGEETPSGLDGLDAGGALRESKGIGPEAGGGVNGLHDGFDGVEILCDLVFRDDERRCDFEDHEVVAADLGEDVVMLEETHDEHLTEHAGMDGAEGLKGDAEAKGGGRL